MELTTRASPTRLPEFKGRNGGGNLAANVVGSILGIKINNWVAVDFHAFKATVDALGGVDVNVETAFTDYQYPRNDDPNVDPSWMTIHFNAGLQHMNGERAIEYARSRHSLEDGTDFGRSKRQQQLLLAIKEKALTPDGMSRVFSLMDRLSGDFTTNMTIGQVKTLVDETKGLDPATLDRISIDDTNYLSLGVSADGQSILLPQNRSWTALRAAVASLFVDPAIMTEGAHIQLLNGSGVPGLASNVTTMLTDLGLQTLPPLNTDSITLEQTEIHDMSQGRAAETVSYLAGLLDAKVISDPPSPDATVDIKVILGKDYTPSTSGTVDDIDPTAYALGSGPATPPQSNVVSDIQGQFSS